MPATPSIRQIIPAIERNLEKATSDFNAESHKVIRLRSVNFLKQRDEVVLLDGVALEDSTTQANIEVQLTSRVAYAYTFLFENLPDTLLNMLHVNIYLFRNENASGIGDFSFTNNGWINYMWELVDQKNYMLHIHVSAKPTEDIFNTLVYASVAQFNTAIRETLL